MLFTSFVILTLLMAVDCKETPQVTVRQGDMEGTHMTTFNGKTFLAFKGIPYAKPPTAERRFKLPEAANAWNGVLDATKEGAACPQLFEFLNRSYSGEEDCLFLNVYTPKLPTNESSEKFPVLVFIHGGGFVVGSGGSSENGPKRLMDQDVVFVTMNYRLGALGFLSTEDAHAPGNLGLWDQKLSLEWVHDNIQRFGGDPDHVTLFGISAGAASVILHLTSPTSAGLFHGAIAQSGSSLCHWSVQPQPLKAAQRLARDLHCPITSTDELVECLRNKTAEEIVRKTTSYQEAYLFPLVFTPTIDVTDGPKFLEDDPNTLLRYGRINRVPVISGITSTENLFIAVAEAAELSQWNNTEAARERLTFIISLVAGIDMKFIPEVLEKYLSAINISDPEFIVNYERILSDGSFDSCNYLTVEFLSKANLPVFMYKLEHQLKSGFYHKTLGNNVTGVAHGQDIGVLFESELFPEEFKEEEDKIFSEKFINMWVNFAKFGDPTAKEGVDVGVTWDQVEPRNVSYLRLKLPLEMAGTSFTENQKFVFEKSRKSLLQKRYCDEL